MFTSERQRLSVFGEVIHPKLLSLQEFQALLEVKYPVYTLSTHNSDVVMFSFPPGYELAEYKHFSFDKIREAGIMDSGILTYKHINEVYVLNKPRESTHIYVDQIFPACPEFTNVFADKLLEDQVHIEDFVDKKLRDAVSKEVEYIYNFELSGHEVENVHHPFALHHLDTPLNCPKSSKGMDISGINTVWSYMGNRFTTSPFHLDDFALASVNSHVAGSTKIFIIIPQRQRGRFESKLSRALQLSEKEMECPASLRKQRPLVTLKTLRRWKVKYAILFQNPGNYLMIKSNVWHAVINLGFNVNRAVNYCDELYFNLKRPECPVECEFDHENRNARPVIVDLHHAWDHRMKFGPTYEWRKIFDETPGEVPDEIDSGSLPIIEPPSSSSSIRTEPPEFNFKVGLDEEPQQINKLGPKLTDIDIFNVLQGPGRVGMKRKSVAEISNDNFKEVNKRLCSCNDNCETRSGGSSRVKPPKPSIRLNLTINANIDSD